uniref:NB-ARC domain-containing protein n=1 Tax=Setaria viridis TaxID=4556 RepID=A0A4V6D6F2_SETVI|nr:hypothetical protein SEVIR_8G146300v2 [Setaria viridis]
MEERFAPVTAATGALGPVLVKLAALLGDEYKLQEGTQRGIESIKSELETVHHLLGKLWGRLDLDVACKNWMTEARELSYDMEGDIDGFTLGLECGDGSFIQREATDSPFKEFMERVKDVSKRCGKMQKIGDCNRSKLPTDPRALFLHRDASELVGMEEKKEKLIKLLQKHEMVCLLGPGGMGKTTLADLVYHAVGDEFQCRTFVSVHPSPNMTDILGTILSQVITDGAMSAGSGTEPAAEQNIVTDISISLSETRYDLSILTLLHSSLPETVNSPSVKILPSAFSRALGKQPFCRVYKMGHSANIKHSAKSRFAECQKSDTRQTTPRHSAKKTHSANRYRVRRTCVVH